MKKNIAERDPETGLTAFKDVPMIDEHGNRIQDVDLMKEIETIIKKKASKKKPAKKN